MHSRINDRFGRPPQPNSIEELRAAVPRLHRFFAEQETLVRAVATTPALRPFWDATRRRREESVRRALQDVVAHLPKAEVTAIYAIILRLVGVEGWIEMKDHWHLDDATITATTQRVLDALIADLERDAASRKKES